MQTDTPRTIHLKDYRPSDYLIDSIYLDFILAETETKVYSRLEVRPNPMVALPSKKLHLDGENLNLNEVRLDGKVLGWDTYIVTSTELIISQIPITNFQLEIVTTINPQANIALTGLYLSKGIYCTQCEAEGFRRITYFLDRPDILAKYTTRIEARLDKATILLSNGNLITRDVCEDGKRHYVIWEDPHPKPSYLFALVGGNLESVSDSFTTASGKEIDLRIYVEPGKSKRCSWAMDSLKKSMRWDEQRFGREYDLDVFNIVAVSDFNMGAMENKGLNIFNDRLILASSDTATDKHYQQILAVVAHEYFHNWTGNRITCRDWFHLCLKEGLAVFRDQEFVADHCDHTVERIESVRTLRARQFAEDAGPLSHPVRPSKYIEINNFYTATVYEKGAELVRMIQTILGSESFRAGIDLYFERHDYQSVTIEDFIKCFEDTASIDLSQFFTWYTLAGTPELLCKLKYDAKAETAELFVKQTTQPTQIEDDKKTLHIPLKIGLLDGDGNDFDLLDSNGKHVTNGVVHITQNNQTFKFKNITHHPVPSYLRGFSAPVKLITEQSDQELAFLMCHDSDLFCRWQATTDYAMRILASMVKSQMSGEYHEQIQNYAKALERSVNNRNLGKSYRSVLLKIPSESEIATEIGHNINPDLILKACNFFARALGVAIGSTLYKLYCSTDANSSFSPSSEQSGERALRNACLTLLASRGQARDKELLMRHYKDASNMTDEAHALAMLAIFGNAETRKNVLDSFYERWQDDHIVIDTWFAVQAIVPAKTTLSQVTNLMRCDQFSLTNPNKVRALIGNFATQNPSQFNRPDGKGYDFIGKQVLALDKINPQVAARLLSAFSTWRIMEPTRRQYANITLDEIASKPGLSRDVYEVTLKMLEG